LRVGFFPAVSSASPQIAQCFESGLASWRALSTRRVLSLAAATPVGFLLGLPHVDAPVHAADKRLSKKAENHAYSVAIHFIHYNFVRIHQSLRITPTMGGCHD